MRKCHYYTIKEGVSNKETPSFSMVKMIVSISFLQILLQKLLS